MELLSECSFLVYLINRVMSGRMQWTVLSINRVRSQ